MILLPAGLNALKKVAKKVDLPLISNPANRYGIRPFVATNES
jgi:hypothetical protein